MRASARASVAALALLLLVLGVDWFVEPDDGPMVGLAVGAVLVAVGHGVRTLWPLRRSPSDIQVARFIEEQCPDLEDRLASATEVAAQGHTSSLGDLMLGDAAERARNVDVDRVVARDHVRRSVLRGSVAILALLGVFAAGIEPVSRIARSAWLYAFPYSATLTIEPGAARVVAGDSLRVEARIDGTMGAPSRTPPFLTVTDGEGAVETIPMHRSDGIFDLVIAAVEQDFSYHVTAATLISDEFAVTALFAPQVDRIDVAYQYPRFANLAPRLETDSGDIYAPAGTQVTLTVHLSKPVREGELMLESGSRVALLPIAPRILETSFEVSTDDTYRVRAIDADGLSSPGDVDYFIRTVVDRPPEVEILRPTADREITTLEEVVIEARAQDDFGLERFELVYSVVGQSERAISLLTERRGRRAHGAHTVYGEMLDIEPGDFISYYVRALDTNTGAGAGEIRSDIYFLEVRPFDQEFEEAQSQATAAMDAGGIESLAEVQKDIIVATWRLDRQVAVDRESGDLTTVADAQEELKWATQRMAERILGRGRAMTPGGRGLPSTETQAMRDAIVSMDGAEMHLRAEHTRDAVPPEMEALSHLLKAQAEIRRKQVDTQRGNDGGQGGPTQAREDLSALFDQDLRRDQETNYENRSLPADERDQQDTETARRLRELAERQDALAREQDALADDASELSAEELRRQLERLTREQNELRRELEDLARKTDGSGGGRESQGRFGEISDQMRRAMGDLRRGDASQAAERGQEASARLQELRRQLEGAPSSGAGETVGDVQLEAQQLAEIQREMATDTRRTGGGSDGREARRELSGRADRLAERVESLQERVDGLMPGTPEGDREAVTDAGDELREREVAGENRRLADRLRQIVESDETAAEVARVADANEELAEVLDAVARQLALAGQKNATTQRVSEELRRAEVLRQNLEQIERQLAQMAEPGRTTGRPDGEPQSTDGQSARGERRGGMPGSGRLAALQQQLMRQLSESPELLEEFERGRPGAQRDLEQWSQHWQSDPAPGTEAFKQDLSTWKSLQDDLQVALEMYKETRMRELRSEEIADRLSVGPSERMPEAYRRLVEQYYRSIATESLRP